MKKKEKQDIQSLHSAPQTFLRKADDFDVLLNRQDIYL